MKKFICIVLLLSFAAFAKTAPVKTVPTWKKCEQDRNYMIHYFKEKGNQASIISQCHNDIGLMFMGGLDLSDYDSDGFGKCGAIALKCVYFNGTIFDSTIKVAKQCGIVWTAGKLRKTICLHLWKRPRH